MVSPQPSKLAAAGGNKTVELDMEKAILFCFQDTHTDETIDLTKHKSFSLSEKKPLLRESHYVSEHL